MKQLLLTLLIGGAVSFGQPLIAPPQLGWIGSNGQLRPVLGLAANFVLGDSISGSVVASSFSGSFGFVKTDSSILVLDRAGEILFQMNTDPGPALFAFSSDGTPAFVYMTQSKSLLSWNTDHLETASFSFEGTVLAIGSGSVVVRRDDGMWQIDLSAGTELPIAGVDGPVLLRGDGSLLYADSQSFVLRQSDGTERRIEGLLVVSGFEQMNKDWVHVTERDSSRHFAIRLEPGREQLFQLPDGAQ